MKKRDRSKEAAYKRFKRYGLTAAEFEAMVKRQDGLCSLCKDPFLGDVVVDHCHVSKKVRGLLHNNCNALLGYAQDSIEILHLAADYLDLHREPSGR